MLLNVGWMESKMDGRVDGDNVEVIDGIRCWNVV
jgi:hypothetical protein